MQIDSLTLNDLSILKGEDALYSLLAKCNTNEGNELLWRKLQQPLSSIKAIKEYQEAIQFWLSMEQDFSWKSTNGAIIMIQQFLKSNEFTEKVNHDIALQVNTWMKQLVNKDSLQHINFLSEQLSEVVKDASTLQQIWNSAEEHFPAYFQKDKERLNEILAEAHFADFLTLTPQTLVAKKIALVHAMKRYGRGGLEDLIQIVAKIDLIHTLAQKVKQDHWVLPTFVEHQSITFEAEGLYHPLVNQAKAYNITFQPPNKFLLLTGANMSGKSTFMRTIGIAAVLAHCGFPVPASSLKLTCYNALITQINVQDDLSKGESYFYAEVLRMKQTAQRIQQQGNNLIIMDELFKGTNVHDAYECSWAVVNGLSSRQDNLVLLSTHLHELADRAKDTHGLFFKYFETLIHVDKSFKFTYQLKDGISKDRIGYSLLVQEGVIDLLK